MSSTSVYFKPRLENTKADKASGVHKYFVMTEKAGGLVDIIVTSESQDLHVTRLFSDFHKIH